MWLTVHPEGLSTGTASVSFGQCEMTSSARVLQLALKIQETAHCGLQSTPNKPLQSSAPSHLTTCRRLDYEQPHENFLLLFKTIPCSDSLYTWHGNMLGTVELQLMNHKKISKAFLTESYNPGIFDSLGVLFVCFGFWVASYFVC